MIFLIFSIISLFPFMNIHLSTESWQVINHKSYSIELPSGWIKKYDNERIATMSGTSVGTTYTSWNNEALTESNGLSISSLIIESFDVQDKSLLSVEKMHETLLKFKVYGNNVIKTLEEVFFDGGEKYVLLRNNSSMSVTEGVKEYKTIQYVLLLCCNNVYYILTISTPQDASLDKIVIERILNSFKLKG